MTVELVTVTDAVCDDCGRLHLTKDGHPSCPGHIRNGTSHGVRLKALGSPCAHELGWGTVHSGYGLCRLHGGNLPIHIRRAQTEIAYAECDSLGIPVPIDPGDALLQLVHEWNGNVAFYRAIVSALPTFQEDDVFTPAENGDDEHAGHWERADPVLVGRTYHQSGVPTGMAERSIYLRLYEEASDKLSSYSQAALRAGVEERQIRLDEAEARRHFQALVASIDAAGLTREQADVFRRTYVQHIDPERLEELGGVALPT